MKYFPELSRDQRNAECTVAAGYLDVPYFVTGHDAPFFWIFFILVPLALLWILGGVTLGTVRWIRRGFVRSSGKS
jgi:hypothetical protein